MEAQIKNYVIAGPGTRKRVVRANNLVVGPSGDLQVWSYTALISAYADGEWSSFWIEENQENQA